MIPEALELWNIESIKDIISNSVFENDVFDLKEKLPDSRDEQGKERIRKTCAAFANSNGGYLIFGVKDGKELAQDERIVGIDKNYDLPEKFGSHASQINPSIEWKFLNPPINIGNDRVIHVVRINCNYAGPHAIIVNGLNSFPKRTNKGNEDMSYMEIKMGFMNFYERKLKINLIRAELLNIARGCNEMKVAPGQASTHYSLVTLNSNIIESLLPDVYLIIANDLDLLNYINALRTELVILDNKCRIFYSTASLPMTGKESNFLSHNQFEMQKCERILNLINQINLRLNLYCI